MASADHHHKNGTVQPTAKAVQPSAKVDHSHLAADGLPQLSRLHVPGHGGHVTSHTADVSPGVSPGMSPANGLGTTFVSERGPTLPLSMIEQGPVQHTKCNVAKDMLMDTRLPMMSPGGEDETATPDLPVRRGSWSMPSTKA